MRTADQISALRDDLRHVEQTLTQRIDEVVRRQVEMAQQIAALRELVQSEGERCPYRETLAEARANHSRLTLMDSELRAVRLEAARTGATSGGIIALISAILVGLGKALGWW